jgi:short-subunit dehydrogenase
MTANTPLALVTGASTGIGRALARQFVDHGYDVVVVADEPAIHDTAGELRRSSGLSVVPIQADLTQPDEVRRVHQEATHGDRTVQARLRGTHEGQGPRRGRVDPQQGADGGRAVRA